MIVEHTSTGYTPQYKCGVNATLSLQLLGYRHVEASVFHFNVHNLFYR